jgi:hypothetical protein
MSRTNHISTLLGSGGSDSLAQTRRLLSTQGNDNVYVSLGPALSSTAGALAQLESAALAQAASIAANKPASVTSGTSGGTSATNTAKNMAESVFGGFTLSPIVRGLMSLFGGGGDSSAPASLPRYTAPYRISMEGGLTDGASGTVATDYGQYGQPRAISSGTSQAQAVTVNVQAMDSQSFLDRSDDIARAVKRAMLESSSLNDVVSEL